MRRPSKADCHNPDCRSTGKSANVKYRGLCDACYRALMRLVKSGALTLEEAELQGRCRRPVPAGSRRWPQLAK
jgi:hypothetical protein